MHRSDFYAWSNNPLSNRRKEDSRLIDLIKESFQDSDRIYGSSRIFCVLRELGETCGVDCVARIMRENMIIAQPEHRAHQCHYTNPTRAAPNRLLHQFVTPEPDKAWVTASPIYERLRAGCVWRLLWICSPVK